MITAPSPAVRPTAPTVAVETLADVLIRLSRLLQTMRSGHTPEGTEKAALALLPPLLHQGPLRSSALAELVHAGPSTISRHVAELLRRDLVRREADPVDGRASLLAVTEQGREAVAGMCARRDAMLAHVVGDWPADDVAALTSLLARFIGGLEGALPTLPARLAALTSSSSDTRTPATEGPTA